MLLINPAVTCLSLAQETSDNLGYPIQTAAPSHAKTESAAKDGTESLEEALDKKPGINFNTVQVSGQSSDINLSSIRADSVESLEALKLATPDMDADIVGGTLNLKFRPAYAQSKPTRQVRAYLTQYDQTDRPGTSFYFTHGQSFGNGNRWGYLLNARIYELFLREENLFRDWQQRRNSAWPDAWRFQDVIIEKEDQRTRSASANLLLDYEWSNRLRLFVRGIFANTDRTEVNRNLEYEWDDGKFLSLDDTAATVQGMSLFKRIEDRKNERRTRELTLGLEYEGDDWNWETQFKYDHSLNRYPHRWDSYFIAEDIDASYKGANGTYPQFSLLNDSASLSTVANEFEFDEVRVITTSDLFVDKIASFDLERKLQPEKGYLTLKTGVKVFNRDLDSKDDALVFDKSLQDLSIANFESDWNSGPIHNGHYEIGGFHDHEAFKNFFQANPDNFVLNETRTRSQTDPANYTVNETVSSAFLMGDYSWDRWRVLGGLRFERTEDEFTGKEVTFDENGDYESTIDGEGGRTYSEWFPGIHAVFTATDKLTLHTSWSKALERPRYYYLAPFRRIIQRSQNIRAGNPDLKATVFTSFLAAADWSYHPTGFLSLELLRRDHENIVVASRSIIQEGEFKDFDLYTWENAAEGILNQVQLVWSQDLAPLQQNLDGFSFEMRYNKSDTETDVRGPGNEALPIAGVPDDDIRASLIYEKEKWELRLRADHQSTRLRLVGSDADRDTYYYDWTDYDFTVEYRADNGWVGNLGVYNFDEGAPQTYFGDPNRPADLANRGRYYRGSVSYSF